MPNKRKKNSLFPIGYDEISLVDSGASQEADVLIFKREVPLSKARPSNPREKKLLNAVKNTKYPGKPGSKTGKDRKPESDPCKDVTNSTGAKEDDPSKKSERGKNYKEERHKRKEDGTYDKTSAESKKKYGKGGTTKAKQDAECRSKGVKKSLAVSRAVTEARLMGIVNRKV